jgi:excisionase family DNA binding protein
MYSLVRIANKKMQNTTIPELLTLRQACELLQVHPNTLRNWEREGKLQAVRIGTRRDRRFTKQALSSLYTTLTQPVAA